jgi:ribosomal protein S18 acetylase RimI-like enzyme
LAALAAVEAQFLAATAHGARRVETPAFRLHLWNEPDPFYRNVAVPTRRPATWRPAIKLMRQAFAAAQRSPRLEFLEERWPDLHIALGAADFACEARLQVMISHGRPRPKGAGRETDLRVVHYDPATASSALAAYLDAANAAFAQPLAAATRDHEAALLAAELRRGGCRLAAVVAPDQAIVAGAGLIGMTSVATDNGSRQLMAELAGVWTAPAYRHRGIATMVAGALVERFTAAGGTAWLGAETVLAASLYARLGFVEIGHQLNFSAPSA